LHHLHHQLTLSLGYSYGSLGKTSSNGFRSEIRAPLPLLRLKISKPTYRLTGDVDPNVLGRSVGVADQSCYSPVLKI
jgi:hypothetical protein